MTLDMSYNHFSASMTHESHDEYVWSTHGSLALPDVQAISNLAGITYGYDSGRVTSSGCAEEVDFVDRRQLHWYDVHHPQTVLLHYGNTYEAHSQEPHIQELSPAGDDDYYYANGLLSTHRFSKSTPTIQDQALFQPTTSPFVPDVQDSVDLSSDSQEPFPTSLTPLPFPSVPVDDPINEVDSYPKINHDFLLPNQHSTYSELSANLVYMAAQSTRLYEEAPVVLRKQQGAKRRKREKVTTRVKPADKQLKRVHGYKSRAPLSLGSSFKRTKMEGKGTSRRGLEPVEGSLSRGQTSPLMPETLSVEGIAEAIRDKPAKHIPLPSAVGKTSTLSANRSSTKKKLGLACLFCRERKIACGRPSESNPDQTCNQCARRFFKCEYPIESRRGQHKRPKSKPDVA